MTTNDLCKAQMDELKRSYVSERNENISYGELLASAIIIPDEVIHEQYDGTDFTDDDFFCTVGKTKLEYYVECFERDLILYINPEDEAKMYECMDKAYDYWILEDEVSCVCCEEYICDCLREIGFEFLVAEYEEEEDE